MKTQCQDVLDYMKRTGSITDKEARDDLGITRVGARIWDLRRMGHEIKKEMIEVRNRNRKACRVAKYSLVEPPVYEEPEPEPVPAIPFSSETSEQPELPL